MESNEDVEMNEESFSNSAEGSSDNEEADDEKIAELQQLVATSPYTYDPHVKLISQCRKAGDLDKLRKAREEMSKLFPLSPELWLDWLSDEKTLASTKEQKEELIKLFERSVKDYTSVSVWMEYVQYSIGQVGEGWEVALSGIRDVFERAIRAVGIHATQGYQIWAAYVEFESQYWLHLKTECASSDEIKKQKQKICNVFRRQLSIPLIGMERIYIEYKEFYKESDADTSSIEYSYKKALQKLKLLIPYEDALDASESPHYEEYKNYIKFEKEGGDPIRIQNIYERSIIDNCLQYELWLDYLRFVDQTIKIKDISIPLYERAVRNCPWSAQLWVSYGRALEHFQESHKAVIDIFEAAFEMGFTKVEDFRDVWLAYLDYLRRELTRNKDSKEGVYDFTEIEGVFNRAIDQMNSHFWGTEAEYEVLKYWIFFNAKYKKDLDNSRKCWKEIINHGHHDEARVWLEYANFERLYGDGNHYRNVLFQALCSVSDWPETFSDLLITFEREEGTLESLEKSLARCQTQLRHINEKRLKKMENEAAYSAQKDDKRKRSPRFQKKTLQDSSVGQSPVQMDSEGFKIPPVPGRVSCSPEFKTESQPDSRRLSERKRKSDDDELEQDAKKIKVEKSDSHGTSVKHDATKDDRTVFISNLSYKLNEDQIKCFFSEVGEIEEIRLVKDFKGRSKGFCYLVFKTEESAKTALIKDRSLLDGRPVLVSPCEDKKNSNSSQVKFKFGTGLEKNKLFVKGLPFSTTKEEVEDMFKECGKLKDVRLVTYRNGHSKGLAYVEYVNEVDAANAVVKMDGHKVQDQIISVAISNPPSRKPKKDFAGSSSTSVSQSLGKGSVRGPRGRGRTQISLVPRSVVRPPSSKSRRPISNKAVQNGQSSDSSNSPPGTKLSNSDFANMFKK